jgi:hypothetical protein
MAQSDTRKAQLIRELDAARGNLRHHASGVRSAANLPAQFRASFAKKPLPWIGGIATLGIALSFLRPGRRKASPISIITPIARRAGIFSGIASLLFEATKPLLMTWATRQLALFVENTAENLASQHKRTPPPKRPRPSSPPL